MKGPIRVTLYSDKLPSLSGSTSDDIFVISRLENAVRFEMPTSWGIPRCQKNIGSLLNPEEVDLLLNNPDFQISCVAKPERYSGGEFGVRKAVEDLHASLNAAIARLGSDIKWLAACALFLLAASYFFRK